LAAELTGPFFTTSTVLTAAEDAKHVIVTGGGVIASDAAMPRAHAAGTDVDAAAHALAVGPTAATAAAGLLVGDACVFEVHRAAGDKEAAAPPVAAVLAAGPADGLISSDPGVGDGEGSDSGTGTPQIGNAAALADTANDTTAANGLIADKRAVRDADGHGQAGGTNLACKAASRTGAAGAAGARGATNGPVVRKDTAAYGHDRVTVARGVQEGTASGVAPGAASAADATRSLVVGEGRVGNGAGTITVQDSPGARVTSQSAGASGAAGGLVIEERAMANGRGGAFGGARSGRAPNTSAVREAAGNAVIPGAADCLVVGEDAVVDREVGQVVDAATTAVAKQGEDTHDTVPAGDSLIVSENAVIGFERPEVSNSAAQSITANSAGGTVAAQSLVPGEHTAQDCGDTLVLEAATYGDVRVAIAIGETGLREVARKRTMHHQKSRAGSIEDPAPLAGSAGDTDRQIIGENVIGEY